MTAQKPTGPVTWSTPTDIADRLRRTWQRGDLLRAHASRAPFEVFDMPLRRPASADLVDHLEEARRWAASIVRASGDGRVFDVEFGGVGGRYVGRSELPSRVRISTYAQAWRLLGATDEVARFDEVLRLGRRVPAAHVWVLAHPIRAIELTNEWTRILAARDWLDWHRASGKYLREIDAPGVDTKFIERHRSVLAEMLGVPTRLADFAGALGLAQKPSVVRMRFDPNIFGLPHALTEATLRSDELSALELQISRAIIVENEVSYLSVPVPEGGVVLWGRGYDANTPASLRWLTEVAERGNVAYWGDIDTHGFAILNRVRAYLPGVRSVMMDRDTLLAHEDRWGSETTPTNAALPLLTDAESALYADLVTDRYGAALRLEQERIDWAWVTRRIV